MKTVNDAIRDRITPVVENTPGLIGVDYNDDLQDDLIVFEMDTCHHAPPTPIREYLIEHGYRETLEQNHTRVYAFYLNKRR